ncbi:MAG: HAMP domain-containing sensor histidine kinase [Deltaproteobacteria bacterium]|nr:HAMP domain-containing sensor histidine kinase [Deltaproteobacteria bacterium]
MSPRFFELYDEMLGEPGIPAVLNRVSAVVSAVMGAEATTVFLVRSETRELEASVTVDNVPRTIRIPIDYRSFAGFCASTKRSFLVGDAYGDLSHIDPDIRFDRSWDEATGFKTRDMLCAPAIYKEEVVGVVEVLNSRVRPFEGGDIPVLESVARLVGYALNQARMHDDLASMKQVEREKAKFMRIMVHELKAPVSASVMLVDAMCMADLAEEQRAQMLGRIRDRLGALLAMVKETLELSKVAAGELLGDVVVLDLAREVPLLCRPFEETAAAKGLQFFVKGPQPPLPVRVDAQGLGLIVSNLVSNAIKYTPRGAVTVEVLASREQAEISVSDSGIGVPETDLPRLFTEYFRASNAVRSSVEGTGIGLASVKGIAERFGGQLRCETRENEGSTFVVSLPRYVSTEKLINLMRAAKNPPVPHDSQERNS